MKVLRIIAEGLPLFKDKFDFCFYAQQRVSDEQRDSLYPLFSSILLNTTNVFTGINASGKTSSLKVILFALQILLNRPINDIRERDILGQKNKINFKIFYYSEKNQEIRKLETNIAFNKMTNNGPSYVIESEKLWSKKSTKFITRKQISDFDNYEPILIRNSEEKFLADDISIVIAKNKEDAEQSVVTSLLGFTNVNILPFNEDIPLEIIKYFDPSIEYLYIEKDERKTIHLKFKGKSELLLFNTIDLNKYLSSGTIRGIFLFSEALNTLQNGGYILVDELENHFNKEIVCTIIRIFKNNKLNKNGGTLIYSTHYPELLDEYDRNDNIFITKNQDGITVENLSYLLKRNDIKKSEVYQSGYLKGTTPSYNSYIELKRKFESILALNKVE
ncbi:AAA family ATPase [Succinivibrio sp.]|uniref:AAA family ATPase n=1 Tax=Succinivibrio sp. TaxID=2053619 RepID=UPI002582A369|nr:AAA family ATPase [Succinivibrio sp.]MDD6205879.1 AAA family ATPase [Succinivibrio sp.]